MKAPHKNISDTTLGQIKVNLNDEKLVYGYLNKDSLCAYLGGPVKPLGKSTINDWMKTRNFPKPIRLSSNFALWRLADVAEWVEAQAQREIA